MVRQIVSLIVRPLQCDTLLPNKGGMLGALAVNDYFIFDATSVRYAS